MRQRRLGAELRRLRQQADLSTAQAGVLDGSSQPRISSIESGRYAVGADRVRALARGYSCTDEAYINALTEMTGGRTRGWWDEYRDMLPPDTIDLAELEHHATSMYASSVVHLPGLLQTRAHAHAVIRDVVPSLDTVQLDTDHGAAFLDTQPHLAKYRTVLDRMESCSLEPSKSRDLIHRVAAEL
ncbi:Cys-tRNA deacylase YbaK [Streptomyces sp. L-9-10]|uniref:helix-turn-helix domain-containing protein n=1 Tax=Streptomyces sp. L-9-10 TaxID=1478131 RepID=UPI00101D3FDF|nr:helix-turn-helix transcriptional regulator [Streptomyces sp. L-9-10]RYJ27393.1 Cys-tRNA deacylase YbaK [Streptomyces sp. L-9-10]